MGTLYKIIGNILDEKFEHKHESIEEGNADKFVNDIAIEAAKELKNTFYKTAPKKLEEIRRLSRKFEERNMKRWANGFDLLEILIVLCTEIGAEFNKFYRPESVQDNDLVFDLVVRHHARACHISQEILCLLKAGYPDGAHSRWRALHEVTVTAMFIAKHGQECAERFYFHDIVDSYDGMKEHKKYEDRLQEKGHTQEEIDECKKEYDVLIEKYGKKFGDFYGWASYVFPNHTRVTFTAIEKDVGLDHMRPYYKWASQNIHAGSKGMSNRLGLCEAQEDILLVGQSNSGMTDPAHATAIGICQITTTLLVLKPTLEHIVLMKLIAEYEKEVGEIFLNIDSIKL